jgi:uncharacterized protein YndB with AHSA1/START domain
MSTTKTPDAGTRLELRRVLPVPREVAFQAFTLPDRMAEWFAPGPMTARVRADVRQGGKYRIEMRGPDGASYVAIGTYREIIPNERLVFTWGWEGPDYRETLVTVEFRGRDASTELLLRHERFVSSEDRDRHLEGWNTCLEKLDGHLGRSKDSEERRRS